MTMATMVLELPIEILLKILDFSDAHDIVSLFSTCRSLYTISLDNDAVWRDLCARYRVYSLANLPLSYQSHRALYTRLLHAHGPLLGLWASDAPFGGAIYDVRFDPCFEDGPGAAGIVGWKWETSRRRRESGDDIEDEDDGDEEIPEFDDDDELVERTLRPGPQRPKLIRSFKVAFDRVDVPASRESLPYARSFCYRAHDSSDPPRCLLALGAPHARPRKLLLHLPAQATSVPHPIFPTQTCGWLDEARSKQLRDVDPLADASAIQTLEDATDEQIELLRSVASSPEQALVRPFLYRQPQSEAPEEQDETEFTAGDGPLPARALIVLCPCYQDGIRRPELSVVVSPQRLYPLRYSLPEAPTLPVDGKWSPEGIQGLWLGDYGPHGTEVIWISHSPSTQLYQATPELASVDEAPHLHASKVTGDLYVPRGVQTWKCNLDTPIEQHELDPLITKALGLDTGDESASAELGEVYSGWATISEIGFL
jgi:hypothetical protein